MSVAYKCDGCGQMFEKKFPSWNRYLRLPNGKEIECSFSIGSNGISGPFKSEPDICNSCLAKVLGEYLGKISRELSGG